MIRPSAATLRSSAPSRIAVELAFFDHPLVRLVGAFDSVLVVIALGRQELCDLVDATHSAMSETPNVFHHLANFEFMFTHSYSVISQCAAHRVSAETGACDCCSRAKPYHGNTSMGECK